MSCQARNAAGGKGNAGMFIERDPKVCAAGIPSAQANLHVSDSLKEYSLQDEVDALISDAIIPPPVFQPPSLHKLSKRDMRNAGIFSEGSIVINPATKTKFQTLVEDLKNTVYTSYWKKAVGKSSDPVPMFPEGFDITGTTFGKKTPFHGRLYDIVMPIDPVPDKAPEAKKPGRQFDHYYCKPPYDPNVIYGIRYNVDPRGKFMKCCLTDNRIVLGTSNKQPISSLQANFQDATQTKLAHALAPNNNIDSVPEGFTFGKLKPPDNLPECLTTCQMNPERELFKKCLGHLNLLRKCLSKRFEATFFNKMYLHLRYLDRIRTEWLPKEIVYEHCTNHRILFNSSLIESLLTLWNAYDGYKIHYKTFTHMINYREPSPELPKVPDIPEDCIDFRTTYSEMCKPGQKTDTRFRAGLPSGNYFDKDYPVTPRGCCKADRNYLPEETDAKACLVPSVFTLLGVTHRDMYASREPDTVRRVFEASGETFDDETFNKIWAEAKSHNSHGLVSYETFRRALNKNDSRE